MLTLDAATRAEYDAQSLAADKGQAVVGAIVDPVSVTVRDDTDAVRASGTMDTPWATVVGDRIVIGEVTSFSVTNGTGGAIPAGWTLRFESGARSASGSFGHSGTDFTWSLPTFETGQGGYLGTVEFVPQGNVPVQADYSPSWSVGAPVTKDIVLGWTVAAAGSSPLAFTPPSSINMVQGGTYDLSQHVSGGVPPYTYDHATFSLPAGTTLNFSTGLITSSPTATITSGWSVDFGVSDSALTSITKDVLIGWNIDAAPVTPGILPTFGVTSALGGSNLPFAFGHAFKQGAVPAGSYVNSDLADWQAVPTTYWPDGSLRHAIIAGRATCSAAVLKSIALSVSATNRSGTALTETDLAAAMPTVTLAAGGDSFTLNSLIGTAARHRTVCTGPVMSNWIYRRPIAGSTTLVAWFDVRLYKGGAVEIFPWIENGYLTVANPVADTRSYTLTIGGVTKFSATNLRICHHTRIPLIDNSAASFKHWSYWVGTDPQIEPRHDPAYLQATKLVPHYGWAPGSADLDALLKSYVPNSTFGMTSFQTSGGDNAAIIGHSRSYSDPMYVITGDARAYRSMLAHALSGGSWHVHARAEASSAQGAAGTPNEPIKFSVYPTASYNQAGDQNPWINMDGDGVVNAPRGNMWGWGSHQPSFGYLAWLCTGRWWHLDEMIFWAGFDYLLCTPTNRQNASGVQKSNSGDTNAERGAAWTLRALAQALACVPSTHPLFADLKAAWEANMAWYHGAVVAGTVDGGAYVNNLGSFPKYGTVKQPVFGYYAGYSDIGAYMQMMLTCSIAYASDLGLPVSATAASQLVAVRNNAYKMPVGMAGAGDPSEWDYRWFGPYAVIDAVQGGAYMADWNASFDAMKAATGASPSGTALQRPGTTQAWSDPTYLSSYFGQHLAALAYAVDHGFAGAPNAWNRVVAASNYASFTSGFSSQPQYGITPRSSVQPQTGLLFPSNNVAGGNIGLDWTGADMVPAHSHTLIWKARYVQQTGYYAVAWHCRADDTFAGGGDYIGSSPYPCDGTVNGNGQALNYGAGFTTHYHELVPIGGTDYIASPGGSALAVSKGVWYSQARTVEVINGGAQVRFRFWPDIAGNPSFVIEQTFNVGDCALSGAALKFRFGASPWTASGSANSETPSGTLRHLMLYNRALSLAEVQAKLAMTSDDTTDPDRWYSNINPTPNDVSDKSGKGHHPAWANANRPTLVTL